MKLSLHRHSSSVELWKHSFQNGRVFSKWIIFDRKWSWKWSLKYFLYLVTLQAITKIKTITNWERKRTPSKKAFCWQHFSNGKSFSFDFIIFMNEFSEIFTILSIKFRLRGNFWLGVEFCSKGQSVRYWMPKFCQNT